ncbi:MAG TPA: porin [Novosphingobium sp.]|nr:porin [Novosphingobium sp.]HPZ47819.1 porin [Novosphingobium sp.]HQD98483.1 porin [Novosphingobium sp.]
MSRILQSSALALALTAGWVTPVQAAAARQPRVADQLAAMQAQLDRLNARVDTLEGQVVQERARADAAEARTGTAIAEAQAARAEAAKLAAVAAKPAEPPVAVAWKGAPEFTGKDGWSFKPRGRLQVDTGGVDAPGTNTSLGMATELRRAFLGVDGTMPGGIGYRAEIDVANSGVEITDLYLTYKASPKLTLTLGQHKPFWGMEEMTSDLFTSMMERAAFNSAFGYERRVGLSAAYQGKAVLVQGGVFTDNAADLSLDTNNSYSVDGRVVLMPKVGGGQVHLGGSVHYRDFNDAAATTRYRARPFLHTTDVRLVNTGSIAATGETGYGLEAAYINGRFHASAETAWIRPHRPGLTDPSFNGGFAEVGYLLTDDTTAYKNGVYERIRPKAPLGKGGIGAIQTNLRYDWLDLNSGAIVGGRQQVLGASVLWMPTDYVRFIVNYGHLWLNDAAVTATGKRDYQADAFGMRAQFDF